MFKQLYTGIPLLIAIREGFNGVFDMFQIC